ncbi:MAG: hypothetical protein ACRCWR_13285, partial [Saezia sp.]
ACQEFFAQDTYSKFNFLCSDPVCREAGIRVLAINHNRLPEEMIQSPHYREQDKHFSECEWIELKIAEIEESQNTQNEDERSASKDSKNKIIRQITRFTPPSPDEKEGGASDDLKQELDRIRAIGDPQKRRKERLNYSRNMGSSSSSLEALVSCFEELQALDELNTASLQIPHHGTKPYRDIFRPVRWGASNSFTVYYGGAYFKQDYGKMGFSLQFIDKIENTPITFYVAPQLFESYRPGKRLRLIIDEYKKNEHQRPYLRVYWIGSLNKTDKGYSATFSSLAHVALRLVYPQAKKSPEN